MKFTVENGALHPTVVGKPRRHGDTEAWIVAGLKIILKNLPKTKLQFSWIPSWFCFWKVFQNDVREANGQQRSWSAQLLRDSVTPWFPFSAISAVK